MDTKDKFITHEQTKAVTGSLANLQTTQKGNLVAAINDVLENGGAKDADELTFDATKATHTSGSTGEALSKVVPSNTGTEGQVITLDENGKPIWKTPQMGGIELVNVHLATEDSLGTVSGLEVAVSVEGETEERFYTTDASGNCQFKVSHGLQYTVSFPTIEGYHEIADLVVRASLTVRNISETYRKDESLVQEHVIVTLRYQGGGTSKATSVNYTISGSTEVHVAAVVNDVAEFDIPLGSTYRIDFNAVDSFATPHAHLYLAEVHTRKVYAYYMGDTAGLTWIKLDGSVVDYNDVTAEMESELLGLRVATSTLIEANTCFVVPIAYLLGRTGAVIGGKQWCTQNVGFSSIPLITNAATALKAENSDGYNNTVLIIEEATASSRVVPAFTACYNLTFTVGEQTLHGFLGSYAQMKALSDNITNVSSLCYQVFGRNAITVNVGDWWCSTQYSDDYGVRLSNGGWNYYSKNYSFSVVPFVAY